MATTNSKATKHVDNRRSSKQLKERRPHFEESLRKFPGIAQQAIAGALMLYDDAIDLREEIETLQNAYSEQAIRKTFHGNGYEFVARTTTTNVIPFPPQL